MFRQRRNTQLWLFWLFNWCDVICDYLRNYVVLPEKRLPRILAKMFSTLASTLSIIFAGLFATSYQVHLSAQKETQRSVQNAVTKIDLLLAEAEMAAYLAKKKLLVQCTQTVRNNLHTMSLNSPHLRVISLLKDGYLTCSSFNVPNQRAVDVSHYEKID